MQGIESEAEDAPLYNIGVVSRMTGLSIPTLRAWEQRYGFPRSTRTGGGHRLYSHADIGRLRWVKARIEDGVQTSLAIQALEQEREELRRVAPAAVEAPASPATPLEFRQLLELLVHHDGEHADRLLGQVLVLQPLERVVLEMLIPLLAELGDEWHRGRLSVATEHYASNYVRQRLLSWTLAGPKPLSERPVVLAAAPDELHEGGLLAAGVLLRQRRWTVAYLGQSVPLPDLAQFVDATSPAAVVLVAQREETAQALVDWPEQMRSVPESRYPFVGFAGRVFTMQPEWHVRVPGRFLGETLLEGIAALDDLLAKQLSG